MKKQNNTTIKAHLTRSALYLLLLLAVCAIPFALAQRNATHRTVAPINTATADLNSATGALHDRRDRRQAASDLPRRQVGRIGRSPRRLQPGRSRQARRLDVPRDRGPVRGGGRGRRRGLRGHPDAARLRARRDPPQHQRRDQGAPRGARPAASRSRRASRSATRSSRSTARSSRSGSAPRRRSGWSARRSRST